MSMSTHQTHPSTSSVDTEEREVEVRRLPTVPTIEMTMNRVAGRFDASCPVCLEPLTDAAVLESCLHQYCLKCISEWAKISNLCCLCKQPFYSARINVRPGVAGDIHVFDSPLPRKTSNPVTMIPLGRHSARRRNVRPWGSSSSRTESSAVEETVYSRSLQKREEIYDNGLRVRHLGRNSSPIFHAETGPEFWKANPSRILRLVPFIRRDLQAILKVNLSEVELVKEYILAILVRYDLKTDTAIDLIAEFLGEKAEHFVHELSSFIKSSWNVEAWDAAAQYPSIRRIQPRHRTRDIEDERNQRRDRYQEILTQPAVISDLSKTPVATSSAESSVMPFTFIPSTNTQGVPKPTLDNDILASRLRKERMELIQLRLDLERQELAHSNMELVNSLLADADEPD